MQASTAPPLAGGKGSEALSKQAAYALLLCSRSSVAVTGGASRCSADGKSTDSDIINAPTSRLATSQPLVARETGDRGRGHSFEGGAVAARADRPVGIGEALGTDLARCALTLARRFAA